MYLIKCDLMWFDDKHGQLLLGWASIMSKRADKKQVRLGKDWLDLIATRQVLGIVKLTVFRRSFSA